MPADLAAHELRDVRLLGARRAGNFATPDRARALAAHGNTAEAAIDATVAGVGIARVLSYQVAEIVRAGRLAVVLRKHEPAPAPVNVVYNSQLMVPAKVRAFIDLAAPLLKQRLALAA